MPGIGINADFDYLFDCQQDRPVGKCVCCGRELYSILSETCDRCLFDMEEDDID